MISYTLVIGIPPSVVGVAVASGDAVTTGVDVTMAVGVGLGVEVGPRLTAIKKITVCGLAQLPRVSFA